MPSAIGVTLVTGEKLLDGVAGRVCRSQNQPDGAMQEDYIRAVTNVAGEKLTASSVVDEFDVLTAAKSPRAFKIGLGGGSYFCFMTTGG